MKDIVLSCVTCITQKEKETLNAALLLLDSFRKKSVNICFVNASIKAKKALEELYFTIENENEEEG